MALHNRKHLGILLLVLGVLTLPTLFLRQLPLIGIVGLLVLVTGILLTFGREPRDDTWLFP